MKISDSKDKIKVIFNPSIMEQLGDEKLLFEINECLIPKIENLRNQSVKNIPLIRIFDSDDISENTLIIINNDMIVFQKQLTEYDFNNFNDLIFEQIKLLVDSYY